MILIADSGSTKTTWALIGSENKVVTEGLNPHFTSDNAFLAACCAVSQGFPVPDSLSSIFFYGAGCGNPTQRERVSNLLRLHFGGADIHVETDMLGACRAVSGRKPSLVGILGTGSNACHYNGTRIDCQLASTGYILGDKGSANHVGRILLNDYLTGVMPPKERQLFHNAVGLTDTQLMDAVYHQPNANRFLASLAPVAAKNVDNDYFGSVIRDALQAWCLDPLQPLMQRARCKEERLNIVGGFAKAIEPTLRRCIERANLTIGTILADPIDGLLAYHSS